MSEKYYAVAEDCYVASRYDTDEDYSDADEPVILIHRGLFKSEAEAQKVADHLNEYYKDKNQIEGFMDDAFHPVELEIK